jgi:hypothetical protein
MSVGICLLHLQLEYLLNGMLACVHLTGVLSWDLLAFWAPTTIDEALHVSC